MITKIKNMPDEMRLAISLLWGHLGARHFNDAYALARGCLSVWPEEKVFRLMLAYAAVELGMSLDEKTCLALADETCSEWREVVLKRAGVNSQNEKAGMQ